MVDVQSMAWPGPYVLVIDHECAFDVVIVLIYDDAQVDAIDCIVEIKDEIVVSNNAFDDQDDVVLLLGGCIINVDSDVTTLKCSLLMALLHWLFPSMMMLIIQWMVLIIIFDEFMDDYGFLSMMMVYMLM